MFVCFGFSGRGFSVYQAGLELSEIYLPASAWRGQIVFKNIFYMEEAAGLPVNRPSSTTYSGSVHNGSQGRSLLEARILWGHLRDNRFDTDRG